MPNFNGPEAGFCIAVLASELMDRQDYPGLPENIDWEAVAIYLKNNRLAAHFYTLGQKYPGLFPPVLREELRQARYANLLYGDQCRREISAVLSALDQSGIPVIVMKGWAVIQWLYGGDHGQRYCEDIDILVPLEKLDQAEKILSGAKYAGVDEVHPGYSREYYNCRAYMRPPENNQAAQRFSFGLHWGLTHYPYFDEKQVPIAELFEHARPLQVAGVDVLELSFEDQLIYTCAHLALHHRNQETLLNYFEIAAIIRRGGSQLDWNVAAARAGKWRYLAQVKGVLKQVQILWPGVIPSEGFQVIEHSQAAWRERLIDRLVAATKGHDFRSSLLELLAMPGFGKKFNSAVHQLFPDQAYMQARYGSAAGQNLFQLYLARIRLAAAGLFWKGGK